MDGNLLRLEAEIGADKTLEAIDNFIADAADISREILIAANTAETARFDTAVHRFCSGARFLGRQELGDLCCRLEKCADNAELLPRAIAEGRLLSVLRETIRQLRVEREGVLAHAQAHAEAAGHG